MLSYAMVADRNTIAACSDYVCPWCYIAPERVDRQQREYPVDADWRPFELHPETPRDVLRGDLATAGGREEWRPW